MQAIVPPSSVSGIVTAPASKSAMQRACAAALIRGGKTILHNPGISADDTAALHIIQQLGARVQASGDELVIESKGIQSKETTIDCGESGLSVRMFTSIAALSTEPVTITGSGSLTRRPLDFFNAILPQLDVRCESNGGLLPLLVQGPLQPKDIEVDGSLSSQFLTGLLFAYAAADAKEKTIHVKNLNSKPYIDLTLKLMSDFGLKTPLNKNYEQFYFGRQSITHFANEVIHYTVEADWSGGAFLLVAGVTAAPEGLAVKGLDILSTQADKAIIDALKLSGAQLEIAEDVIHVRATALNPFEFDATDCPDLFPPLVALAARCSGTSRISGVHRLTHKESNRALTLQEEFGKLGIEIQLADDTMMIEGGGVIQQAAVHSHHDHRIAMACAVAAVHAAGPVTINGAEAVNKSYPQFWQHLRKINAAVTLINN
jgi:3-phosphoshikimate 1-carboxyvinyltransferase